LDIKNKQKYSEKEKLIMPSLLRYICDYGSKF